MRTFTKEEDDGSVTHNFYGDKEGHTMVVVEPPSDTYYPRFKATKNDIVETPVAKMTPDDGTLFLHDHRPAKIDYLTSTAPHQVGGAVAGAALEAKSRWGAIPKISGNLSAYSLPLAHHFADLGLIDRSDVPASTSNSLDLSTSRRRENDARYALRQNDQMKKASHPVLGTEDKDNTTYSRGRSLIRETIKNKRRSSKSKSRQFTNVPLPGMEGM